MRTVCDYTDFFVIATGANTRQTKSISDEVHFVMKRDHELLPRAVAGEREGTWIIADYYDSVLHVFTDETREFYRLEDLWSDVPKLEAAARRGGRGQGPTRSQYENWIVGSRRIKRGHCELAIAEGGDSAAIGVTAMGRSA